MNAFFRTLAYGLAGLCLLLLAGGITTLVMLKHNGSLSPVALRNLVLSSEERDYLDAMGRRAPEPTDAPSQDMHSAASEQQLLSDLAEMANASNVTRLVTKIHRQQQDLDERQNYLDQQWADVQLAKIGLDRMQRQLQEEQATAREAAKQQDEERQRWAAAQAASTAHMQIMNTVEKARYTDQAKLFEQMKDAAWLSLRRFPPSEIARYLALMDQKKAARILILAQQDSESPNLATEIQKEMLHIDLGGLSGDQTDWLATLYSLMAPEQVLPYLKDSSAEDVSNIVRSMMAHGQAKHAAALLDVLRKQDSQREMMVHRLLDQAPGSAPGGNAGASAPLGAAPGAGAPAAKGGVQ